MPDDILVLRSTLLKGILSNDSELVTISVPSLLSYQRLKRANKANSNSSSPAITSTLSKIVSLGKLMSKTKGPRFLQYSYPKRNCSL